MKTNLVENSTAFHRDLRDRIVRVDRATRRADGLRGLPPSIPFLRDDAAFRFDRTEPRHAGQKETKSILWI